jgi:outer membrane immunogenic protein
MFFGYSWRFQGSWLAGVETDVGYANADKTRQGIPGTVGSIVTAAGSVNDSVQVKEHWDGSFRARIGYAVAPRAIAYGTGGLAWQTIEATVTCGGATGSCGANGLVPFSATNSTTRVGWTMGGGVEAELWGAWFARGEYRYSDYGTYTATYGTRSTVGVTSDIRLRTHTMTLGVAMRLGQ